MAKRLDYRTEQLRQRLVLAGVDPQKFDIHAHVDRKLSQRENFLNLTKMTGTGKRKEYDPKLYQRASRRDLNDYRQIGTSNKADDKRRKAMLPGKRYVRHPGAKTTIYYERRKNRSDKPGYWV